MATALQHFCDHLHVITPARICDPRSHLRLSSCLYGMPWDSLPNQNSSDHQNFQGPFPLSCVGSPVASTATLVRCGGRLAGAVRRLQAPRCMASSCTFAISNTQNQHTCVCLQPMYSCTPETSPCAAHLQSLNLFAAWWHAQPHAQKVIRQALRSLGTTTRCCKPTRLPGAGLWSCSVAAGRTTCKTAAWSKPKAPSTFTAHPGSLGSGARSRQASPGRRMCLQVGSHPGRN